ncbi:MAG: hypothetical protein FJY73_02925 [Candidatus Eisenbacteria bacterium]|nr:hypothetical protein [Candidatus Eisenbacteria bacterium]
METRVRRIDYFHATVKDRPGEAFEILSRLRASGVNLLAFSAVPCGLGNTQLVLFPEDVQSLARAAADSDMVLIGPHRAFLVQGDDRLGAISEIHRKLFEASVNVYASNGVTDGKGGYGYIFYVKPEEFERAARALGV